MMRLHENPELFSDAVIAASQYFKIPEIFIEKDYWVTVALEAIFKSDISDEAVFKGGTALSKCHRLIERFSEDIDIVILQHIKETDNNLKAKIKKISKIVETVMPEVNTPGITNKLGQIRKTVHSYPKKKFQGSFGHVKDEIILEVTWLGSFEPFEVKAVNSYIAELIEKTGQFDLIEQYGLQSFNVKVLTKERTLCEKIMSLVRFSRMDDPYKHLTEKIRHVYDIHILLKDPSVYNFFLTLEFDNLLNQVGKDDIKSFKNNNTWLKDHPIKAVIFADPQDTWERMSGKYQTSFRDLVTGVFPEQQELITTLKSVSVRLKKIDWLITPEILYRSQR